MAKILIVDDDQVGSQIYANKLRAEGHEVILASDGKAALEKIKYRFDLILLDIMMPQIGGVEILDEIKKGVNKKTTVVIITNLTSKLVEKECLEKGAREFLLKVNYSPTSLFEKIRGYLR